MNELSRAHKQLLNDLDRNENRAVTSTVGLFPDFDRTKIYTGKVRENYDLGDALLMVATDRISTYDAVHPNGVPGKGIVLTAMTLGWFNQQEGLVKNHLITADPHNYPGPFRDREELAGRSMLVTKQNMANAECVVRGYLVGSGWEDYKRTGEVCGNKLPEGMVEAQMINEPIFTPATKAQDGHDQNIDLAAMVEILRGQFPHLNPQTLAEKLRDTSILVYQNARNYALPRGVIVADTKLEFGITDEGDVVESDEVLTPDSSRFWPVEHYAVGSTPPSFDKQPVRDWARGTGWDRKPPAPKLPEEVIQETRNRYIEAHRRLFGTA